MTPQDTYKRLNSPPLLGRGRGWGLSALNLQRLHDRAKEMRRNPTEPEKRVWRVLSNAQLGGWKFRRQQVIGWFIADFVCPSASLIVEVDGDTHDDAKDRVRDDILGEHGFRVLRVTNIDVISNLDGVAQFILNMLAEKPFPFRGGVGVGTLHASDAAMGSVGTPHPNPSPEGEGLKKVQKLLGISIEGNVG